MIIAVDGPTASGKGTVARGLARHFAIPHLDTGLLYRAVGRQLVLNGGNPDDPDDALAATAFGESLLTDPELRSEAAGGFASRVSVHPQVRAALLERQRGFACQPGGAVLDGRDIGTVIAPQADAKLFVVASVDARTERRFRESKKRGETIPIEQIRADIERRDARDRGRADAPLKQAQDAMLLDNSLLTPQESLAIAITLVENALARLPRP